MLMKVIDVGLREWARFFLPHATLIWHDIAKLALAKISRHHHSSQGDQAGNPLIAHRRKHTDGTAHAMPAIRNLGVCWHSIQDGLQVGNFLGDGAISERSFRITIASITDAQARPTARCKPLGQDDEQWSIFVTSDAVTKDHQRLIFFTWVKAGIDSFALGVADFGK
jgi:hypothetical protein